MSGSGVGAAGDGDLRVSDAERQAVVDRLSRACGEGMLTLDELAEHAGAAYAAVTRAQLDEATRDLRLPATMPLPPSHSPLAPPVVPAGPGPDPAASPKRRWVVAIMGSEERRGKWRAARRTGAFAMMGGVKLDLRDAVLEGEEVDISAWAVMGSVVVIVPEGIPVECSGFMLMGGRINRIKDVAPLPGAPLIRVRGYGMWGGIEVRSKPPRRAGDVDDDDLEAAPGWPGAHRLPGLPIPPIPPIPPVAVLPIPPLPFASPPGPEGGLVTVVCTDIVGSTRLADTLGDQRWRAVLLAHNTLVRGQLKHLGGTEVKTSGDGFLLTFPSARRAVQFAVGVQDELANWRSERPDVPIEVRIGVHAGEVERDGTDVVGRNVSVACRLCDVAAPGEVLASAVVADLADSASDLAFGDPRSLQLAGIDRTVTARPAARR